jgi:hypothetical protein
MLAQRSAAARGRAMAIASDDDSSSDGRRPPRAVVPSDDESDDEGAGGLSSDTDVQTQFDSDGDELLEFKRATPQRKLVRLQRTLGRRQRRQQRQMETALGDAGVESLAYAAELDSDAEAKKNSARSVSLRRASQHPAVR